MLLLSPALVRWLAFVVQPDCSSEEGKHDEGPREPRFKVGDAVRGYTEDQGKVRAVVTRVIPATAASLWEPTYNLRRPNGSVIYAFAEADMELDQ